MSGDNDLAPTLRGGFGCRLAGAQASNLGAIVPLRAKEIDDMSFAKRYLDVVHERGWGSSNKSVCAECVGDPALKAVIREAIDAAECSYCGMLGEGELIAAPLDRVLEAVVDGLYLEYDDPVHEAMWSSADGGYQVPHQDTWDVLIELDVANNDQLHSDLVNAIETQVWCQRHSYQASPKDALLWGWDAFCKYVKHERRFTFLSHSDNSDEVRGWGEIPPEDMLPAMRRAVEVSGMITDLPRGSVLYRARAHGPEPFAKTASALGSPPHRYAKANRMTPAGIGAFYAATSASVAIAEVRGYSDPSVPISVGQFVTGRNLRIVDLSVVPDVPSLFDPERRHLRASLQFIHRFVADATRTVAPDDREHLEYIPTQVVAEYLRTSGGYEPVQGIRWRSTRGAGGLSMVLFVENAACVEYSDGWADTGEATLALTKCETVAEPVRSPSANGDDS
jgi:hypothetical protein